MFKEGRKRDEDEEFPRRPPTSTIEHHVSQIKKLVLANGRLIIKNLVDDVYWLFAKDNFGDIILSGLRRKSQIKGVESHSKK